MTNMNVEEIRAGLERLLAIKSGEAKPTLLERVQLKSSSEWDDDEWEFANQRGLIPTDQHVEYVRRATAKRHAEEMAVLEGQAPPANFGGNLSTGTVTTSIDPAAQMGLGLGTQGPSATVSADDRLRQLDKLETQIAAEREALEASRDAEASASDESVEYSKMTVPKLQAEVNRRNDGREIDYMIQPDSNKKADLVAALEEDDAMQESRQQEDNGNEPS